MEGFPPISGTRDELGKKDEDEEHERCPVPFLCIWIGIGNGVPKGNIG